MAKTVLLDGNIYDLLAQDWDTRAKIAGGIAKGCLRVVATPAVVDELTRSPFGGVPNWFPVDIEAESVAVLDHWHLGEARLGSGEVFTAHRGASTKVPDAIIADSADASADVLVTNDHRCRSRLVKSSSRCRAMDYPEFRAWVAEGKW